MADNFNTLGASAPQRDPPLEMPSELLRCDMLDSVLPTRAVLATGALAVEKAKLPPKPVFSTPPFAHVDPDLLRGLSESFNMH